MRIHISKDGQRFGPFTVDELKAHLAAGHFSESDHVMPEGGSEWQKIEDFLSILIKQPSPVTTADSGSDDIDHEKLKQWEEQFEDCEDDEQQKHDEASVQPSPVSTPQPSPPVQAPVPSVQSQLPAAQPASKDNDTNKEPPPPRRKHRNRDEVEEEEYDDDPSPRKRRSSRRGGSRKISSMNRGRTVIVVKGGGWGKVLAILFGITIILGVFTIIWKWKDVRPIIELAIATTIGIILTDSEIQTDVSVGSSRLDTFTGLGLTEDEVQQLRSIPVEFFKTDGGKALRCVASVEPDLTINDEDLRALESIAEKLVWLDCSKGNLTDAALSRISNLPNIRRLYLEDNKGITSRGVSDLAGLGKLQCLNLVGTSLDDAVIEILTGMSGLREVYLWRSGVSPDAVQRLRLARPDMLVQSG